MSKYLGCVLLFQISFCCASDLNFSEHVTQWLRERVQLAARLNQWQNQVMLSEDDGLVSHRQNAVCEMSSSDLNNNAGYVLYDGDMYKDGFDKIWDCEEQALLVGKQEQEKYDMWQSERLSGEPDRKRRRIEN